MDDKPLDQAEQDLLELIRQLHAEKGPFLRSTLSVVGRGRGLDVARPFNRLKSLGLVAEIEQRPFFLFRLFGAKTIVLIQPTVTEIAAEAPEVVKETVAPASVVKVKVSEPTPIAPVPPPEPLVVNGVAPAKLKQEPIDVAPIEAQVVPRKPARARPKPLPLDAYTDDIGGQPMAHTPVPLALGLDAELLDGMREMFDLLGMELTIAGETMISNRMAKGASAGEALCQVALFAFAHAAHHNLLVGGSVQAEVLHNYAIEVIRELEKLRDAGEVGAEPFERDMRALWALTEKESDPTQLIADLLSDPVGGAAPPALLPEEVRGVTEYED